MTEVATLMAVRIYPENTRKALGRIARLLRQRDGYSQTGQGVRAGISRSTIMRIESGEPVDLRSVNRLEKSFKMPADFFRAILDDDRDFVSALDIDTNFRMTVLRVMDTSRSVEGGPQSGGDTGTAEHR
jgi:transcriptional regulator with XRE-family HTH domain